MWLEVPRPVSTGFLSEMRFTIDNSVGQVGKLDGRLWAVEKSGVSVNWKIFPPPTSHNLQPGFKNAFCFLSAVRIETSAFC